eukprot:TRINITY_DN90616_c0_g1_i1.p1 TRINITY_DN90616_c0_g1~~TRINITY_DN90616_c0_g1_i1.p1  ORF type:complete len:516 (+),score=48.02 TRINITY_DN90616_c0_g1_i1:33-1550(+)
MRWYTCRPAHGALLLKLFLLSFTWNRLLAVWCVRDSALCFLPARTLGWGRSVLRLQLHQRGNPHSIYRCRACLPPWRRWHRANSGHQRNDTAVDEFLREHPDLQASLDAGAMLELRASDAARAIEVVKDLVATSEVQHIRNPSAFVVRALHSYFKARGNKDVHLPKHSEEEDTRLLAAMARFPVFTSWSGREHPRIRLKRSARVADMFRWDKIAEMLGISREEAMFQAFGADAKAYLFLKNRIRPARNLEKVGIMVCKDIITEQEEQSVLAYFRSSNMSWQPRDFFGERANFGPTLTSQYQVHQSYAFTDIPVALKSMRRKVLDWIAASPDIRKYAMTHKARRGITGHTRNSSFNQALVQRYRSDLSPDNLLSQGLPMHFDQRDDWAEIIAGVSLGDPGHIFFYGSRPHTCIPYAEMKRLAALGKAAFIQLPPRSVYVFYGFARYGLYHGVAPLAGVPHNGSYDRITVTWRSVKPSKRASLRAPHPFPAAEESDKQGVGMWGQIG